MAPSRPLWKKTNLIKPTVTPQTVNPTPHGRQAHNGAHRATATTHTRAVIDPGKPLLKLGLDVHLELIMAVAQKDPAGFQSPRQFPCEQLVTQV